MLAPTPSTHTSADCPASNANANANIKASATPPSVEEMQKKMKAQLGTGLPGSKKNSEKFFVNESAGECLVGADRVEMMDTVYIKNCTDMTYRLETTCTKVFIESCRNVKVYFQDRVITQTVEVWKCEDVELLINTKVQTLQVDMTTGVSIEYERTSDFNRLVWSSCENVSLRFQDAPEYQLSTGSTQQASLNAKINPNTDQFIVRLIPNKVTQNVQLLNELIVRLDNGFPTTEREARQFEERQEANLQALARQILGDDVVLGKKKPTGPKVKPNDACPCGAGKKFKKCCGTNAL